MVQYSLGCWNILTPARLNSCSLLLGFAAGPESAACSCGRAGFARGVGTSQQETREVPRDGSGLAEQSSAFGAGGRAGELCSVPNRGAALLSACTGCVLALCARGLSGKSRGSLLSHPLSAGKEEEDEPDSVSVCQQQAGPDSQRSAPVPNPQRQSLACACFGTSAGV